VEWGSFLEVFEISGGCNFLICLFAQLTRHRLPTVITDSKSKKFDDVFLTIIVIGGNLQLCDNQVFVSVSPRLQTNSISMPNSCGILFQASARNKLIIRFKGPCGETSPSRDFYSETRVLLTAHSSAIAQGHRPLTKAVLVSGPALWPPERSPRSPN
jgi:hypothetical protein